MNAARIIAPAAWALVLLVPVPTLADTELPTQPLGAVRSLHHIQDQIAQGDRTAYQVQPSTLRIVDELFAAMDAGAMADPGQRHAALAYAVSGGNPSTFAGLYEALVRQVDDETEKAIAEAVAAAMTRAPGRG